MTDMDRSGHAARADEDDLLRRIRSGDVGALDLFVERQWSPLVAYVEAFVGPDEAEDIAQEAVVRLWEKRDEWTPSGSLRALVYRIARNLALNEVRRRQIQTRRWAAIPPDPPASGPSPSDAAAAAQLRAAVDAALDALPPRRREILILSRFHELSHREIARVLGISTQTVANQISAGMASLRVILRPFLATPDAEPDATSVGRTA